MSTEVDNRVVRMTFDNSQFEKKIKDTMKTLSEFEKSLKMDGATAGIDGVGKAADRLNLSALSKKAAKEASSVSASAADASKSISSISGSAENVDLSSIGNKAAKEAGSVADSAGDVSKSIGSISGSAESVDLSSIGAKAAHESVAVESASADAAGSIAKIDSAAANTDFSPISTSAYNAAYGVNDAATSIDLSPINQQIDQTSEGFNVLQEIAIGALRQIGGIGVDYVKDKLTDLKNFLLNPIQEGFQEYEQQMGSIQTILANTGMDFDSDADIQRVNDALDTLNTYADETVYKFADMTEAIGTFTAAGLTLDEAVAAVKGVSNVAAFSGASTSDVHRVLPQISQALSAGEVSLMDWKSIETAHMNSVGFVNAIGDMAVHMASVDKASAEAAEAGQALIDKEVNMRQALNKEDNEAWAGWLTSDILSETFAAFTYDRRKATADEKAAWDEHLAVLGYETEEEREALYKRAEVATRAATEVRTWDQLWDTVGESIGSNWAGIWRNLIGDFKQATDTFSFLSQKISGGIDSLLGGIVNTAQRFNASGAIDLIFGGFRRWTQEDFENGLIDDENLIGKKVEDELGNLERIRGALDNLVDAIQKPLSAIGNAFKDVFGSSDENLEEYNRNLDISLVGIAQTFQKFTESLIISDDAATGLKHIFEGLFQIFKVGITIVGDIVAVFFKLVDVIRTFLDPAVDIALSLFGQLGRVVSWAADRFMEIRDAVIIALKPIGEGIENVQSIVREFFGFADIPGKIEGVGDGLLDILNKLWELVDIPGKIQVLGDVLGSIFGTVGKITGWNKAVEESNRRFEETGEVVSAARIWLDQLLATPVGQFFKTIADTIGSAIEKIQTFFSNIFGKKEEVENSIDGVSTKMNTFKTIIGSIESAFKRFESIASYVFGTIGNGILKVFDLTGKLLEAIGGLVIRSKDAILAWEPLKKISEILENFKQGAIQFFLDLPNKIMELFDKIRPIVVNIKSTFNDIFQWFEDKINYFSNVSAEQFLADARSWAEGIRDKVQNAFEELSTIDPIEVFNNLKTKIEDAMSNIKLEGIVGLFIVTKDKISDTLSNWFENAGPTLTNAASKFKTFFDENILDADKWAERFDGATNKVKEAVSNAPEAISNAFSKLKDILTEIFNWIGEQLVSIPGPIGDFFNDFGNTTSNIVGHLKDGFSGLEGVLSGFKGNFDDVKEVVTDSSKTLPEKFQTLFGGIKPSSDEATDSLKNFVNVVQNPSGVSLANTGDFIETVKITLVDKFESLKNFLFGLPDRFKEIFDKIKNTFTLEKLTPIVQFIKGLAAIRTLIAGSGLIKTLTRIMNNYSKLLEVEIKRKKVDMFIDTLRSIAVSLAIMGGVLAIIAIIPDPEKAFQTLMKLALMLGGFMIVIGILKKLKMDAGDTMFKGAASIGVFAASMLASMYVIKKLTAFDFLGNLAGIIAMGTMLTAFAGIMALVSRFGGDGGKESIKIAVGIGILALSLNLLIPPIKSIVKFTNSLSEDKYASAAAGIIALGTFVVLLGGAMALAGKHALSASAGFVIMGGAVMILSGALSSLASQKLENARNAAVSIIGILGIFAVMASWIKTSTLIGTALSIIAYAGAIAILSNAIGYLSKLKVDSIQTVSANLIALVGAFSVTAGLINSTDLLKSAAAMVIYSGAIGALAYSLYALNNIKMDMLIASAVALGGLIAVFGGLAKLTKGLDLISTAGGVIAFSAGMIILADALQMVSVISIDNLGPAAATMAGLVAVFGGLAKLTKGLDLIATAGGVIAFSAGMIILADALRIVSEASSDGLIPAAAAIGILLGAFAVLSIATLGVDLIATAGAILLFSGALMVLAEALKTYVALGSNPESLFNAFVSIGYSITGGLVQGIIEGTKYAIQAVINLGKSIIAAFCKFFGIASPSKLMADEIGQYIPEGIEVGIEDNSDDLFKGSDGIFSGLNMDLSSQMSGLNDNLTGGFNDIFSNFNIDSQMSGLTDNLTGSFGGMFDGLNLNLDSQMSGFTDNFTGGFNGMFDNLNLNLDGQTFGLNENLTGDFNGMFDNLNLGNSLNLDNMSMNLTDGFGNMFNGLNENIMPQMDGFSLNMTNGFSSMFDNIGLGAGASIPSLTDTLTSGFGGLFGSVDGEVGLGLNNITNNFGDWISNSAMPALGDMLNGFWNWFTTEGLPALGQVASDIWNWFKTDGIDMLGNIALEILNFLGELLKKFWNWFTTDGIPAIQKAAGDFWNWFTTEGLPMLGNFIVEVLKKLGELLLELGKWVLNDGIPAVGKALSDLMGEAGKLGGMLLDWAKGLPGKIWEGLGNIAQWAMDIGGNIIDGIINGITQFPNAIADSIIGMASGGLDSIKNFFGIASPSKVMRDEVGRYITEGLAEGISVYSNLATKEAIALGEGTAAGINQGLSSVPTDYESALNMNASIVPVLDPTSYENITQRVVDGISASMDMSSNEMRVAQSIDAQVRADNIMGSIHSMLQDQSETMSRAFVDANSMLHDDISALNTDQNSQLTELRELMSQLRVYLDSGQLVGALSPEIDRQLGYRQILSNRGIY